MRKLLIATLLMISTSAFSQFGGKGVYQFLNLTTTARVNALGGNQVGLNDTLEAGLAYYNPAFLHPSMNQQLVANYVNYIADINAGYVLYAFDKPGIGTFATGVHYLNLGNFIEADEEGNQLGTFTAADYAINLIYNRILTANIRAGINVKPIYSKYETYSSFGVAADLGISYVDSAGLFSAGFVLRNMGTQFTTYTKGVLSEKEPVPFDFQIGFSQKLAHAPFRFSLTLQQLNNWNLTDKSTWDFDHKDEDDYIAGETDTALRQFMRHTIWGVEFLPSENVIIGVGYNYQRRRELAYSVNPGAVGFSGGITLKVNRFRFSYAVSQYHLAGLSNNFSVTTRLSDFL